MLMPWVNSNLGLGRGATDTQPHRAEATAVSSAIVVLQEWLMAALQTLATAGTQWRGRSRTGTGTAQMSTLPGGVT